MFVRHAWLDPNGGGILAAQVGYIQEHERKDSDRAQADKISSFVRAYDAWAESDEGLAGPLFDAMLYARDDYENMTP